MWCSRKFQNLEALKPKTKVANPGRKLKRLLRSTGKKNMSSCDFIFTLMVRGGKKKSVNQSPHALETLTKEQITPLEL